MVRSVVVGIVFVAACGGGGEGAAGGADRETGAGETDGPAVAATSRASVLTGPGSATHPEISPDGARLLFLSNAEGVRDSLPINFEIYAVGLDGSGEVRLTDDPAFDADASWSPDGTRIVFKSYRDRNDEIYVMAADGSGATNLTGTGAAEWAPHWHPDGSLIAFASDRDGSGDIFVMAPDGSDPAPITRGEGDDGGPRWSPDGTHIAFVSNRDGDDDVYVMNRDGSEVRRLADLPDSDWSPRWSPDGRTILFISGDFQQDRWTLYAVDVDAPGEPRVVVEGVDSGYPAWHPDGSRIYFGRYGPDGESRLWSARPDGTDARPLVGGG